MSGGLGFTSLMQSITRTNRSLLRHPDKVREKKDNLTYLTDKSEMVYKKISDEEMEKLKARYKAERIKERRKEILVLLVFILIVAGVSLTFILTRK